MKTKLFTTCLFLIITSSSLHAARPSIAGLQQQVGALVNTLLVCPPHSGSRFVDNGDGTICDHQTGLMWEQKDAEDGVSDFSNPHDVDNRYTWTDVLLGETAPNGTVFTDFLARLNGEVASSKPSDQLGGYYDWRLPTRAELQGLVFEPDPCSISPCINPVFLPTPNLIFSSGYWSSTSHDFVPDPAIGRNFAYKVDYSEGNLTIPEEKGLPKPVRAVRGGR
jgi:hypothetical protein